MRNLSVDSHFNITETIASCMHSPDMGGATNNRLVTFQEAKRAICRVTLSQLMSTLRKRKAF